MSLNLNCFYEAKYYVYSTVTLVWVVYNLHILAYFLVTNPVLEKDFMYTNGYLNWLVYINNQCNQVRMLQYVCVQVFFVCTFYWPWYCVHCCVNVYNRERSVCVLDTQLHIYWYKFACHSETCAFSLGDTVQIQG